MLIDMLDSWVDAVSIETSFTLFDLLILLNALLHLSLFIQKHMQQPTVRGIIDTKVQPNAGPMGAPVPISTNPTDTKNSPPIIQQEAKQPRHIYSLLDTSHIHILHNLT